MAEIRSKWVRIFFLLLELYAGLCTVLVTLVLTIMLWSYLSPPTIAESPHRALGPDLHMSNLAPIDLNYDLPRPRSSVDGLFRIIPASDALLTTGLSQTANQIKLLQPRQTNQSSASASGH